MFSMICHKIGVDVKIIKVPLHPFAPFQKGGGDIKTIITGRSGDLVCNSYFNPSKKIEAFQLSFYLHNVSILVACYSSSCDGVY